MKMDIRYQMLCNYLDELWAIKGLPPQTEIEKFKFFAEITGSDCTQWVDICDGNNLIGFLIVGTAPNCHPDADYYVEEAYVKPDYRRKGHMLHAFSEFERKHKGIYCLFVLNKNEGAKNFWKTTFAKLGYLPYFLRDVGAGDEFCTQYGFKPALLT